MLAVRYKKFFVLFSFFVMLLSALFIFTIKPQLSIEFTGGSLFVVKGDTSTEERIHQLLKNEGLSNYSLREVKANSQTYIYIKTNESGNLESVLKNLDVNIERSSFIGPSLGDEMKKKAAVAIILSVFLIILFVAYAFKEVSYPVSSFAYGLIAILALVHDMLVPAAFFSVLGQWTSAEIGSLFVIAMLATLGYSVNDTIVVFDRVRERLKINKAKKIKESFEETVGKAISSTIARSINTSLTTALSLFVLYLIGPESTRYFALALLVGVIAGTYSSIFLAGPALVYWAKLFPKKEKKEKGPDKINA